MSCPRQVFYQRVNELLAEAGFAWWLEQLCRPHDWQQGRGSIAPGGGVFFRMLLVGYFEDIDSQHGIVWRCSDSLSLTSFLGCQPHEATAKHSSLMRITLRLPLEIDREVFAFVLPLLYEQGLLKGTTLEANAAMIGKLIGRILRRRKRSSSHGERTRLASTSSERRPGRRSAPTTTGYRRLIRTAASRS
ncbi:MAG: transposase [Planctomycetales bacterium]|nr:transposase [Planctomycetales bacterium]